MKGKKEKKKKSFSSTDEPHKYEIPLCWQRHGVSSSSSEKAYSVLKASAKSRFGAQTRKDNKVSEQQKLKESPPPPKKKLIFFFLLVCFCVLSLKKKKKKRLLLLLLAVEEAKKKKSSSCSCSYTVTNDGSWKP